ncbi:MAG TPA: hypothetical protein VMX97_07925, partial [Hyphomicrobiaceae bacterium]|nr:hypothetical protein [Hyphomicrobiaceae bacterium]
MLARSAANRRPAKNRSGLIISTSLRSVCDEIHPARAFSGRYGAGRSSLLSSAAKFVRSICYLITQMYPPFCHAALISRFLSVGEGGCDGTQRGAVSEGAEHGRIQSA